MKCPNCNMQYELVKDRYYKVRLVHKNWMCPYSFDFAHHTKALVLEVVKRFIKEHFPWKKMHYEILTKQARSKSK